MILQNIAPNIIIKEKFNLLRSNLLSINKLLENKTIITKNDVRRHLILNTFTWFSENSQQIEKVDTERRLQNSDFLDQIGFEPNMGNYMLTKENGIMYYLKLAEEKVLNEVKNTKVNEGFRIWKLYNMGVIIKTKNIVFAIDLVPYFSDFSTVIDFMIVSHWHRDHFKKDLFDSMIKKGKPVYRTGDLAVNGTPVNGGIIIDNNESALKR